MSTYDDYYKVSDVKPRNSTLVGIKLDVPQIEALTELARAHGVPLTVVVRRACRELLSREAARETKKETEAA